jgi:LysM repeat protein
MFTSLRAVVVLALAAILLVGILLATAVIDATSGGSAPNLTSPSALADATRSLPAYWDVRPGDTFDSIAAATHLSVSQLQDLNPRQDPTNLIAGERLRLHVRTPGHRVPRRVLPRFWTVAPGDTFSSIAAKTGLPIGEIAQFNPTVDPTTLKPGQRLKLRR